eukprot:2641004-Pleurochrysis_carterae.AAC.1
MPTIRPWSERASVSNVFKSLPACGLNLHIEVPTHLGTRLRVYIVHTTFSMARANERLDALQEHTACGQAF